MFYEQIISSSPSTALQKAFDPSYVVLDDPLPAGLAAAVAGYPIANQCVAPVPHDGSTRLWRCANEQEANHFLGTSSMLWELVFMDGSLCARGLQFERTNCKRQTQLLDVSINFHRYINRREK